MRPKTLKCFWLIWCRQTWFNYLFYGSRCTRFLELKELWKFSFPSYFSKAKTEEYDQKPWNVFHQFGVGKPCSTTYFLEGGALVLLKLPTEGFLSEKRTLKIELETCNFIKKESLAQVFSCESCEISKNTFFTEHLLATTSVLSMFLLS